MTKSAATTALRAQLFRTFEDPTYRPPPLPLVALELSALASRDDVDVTQVVRLLERDQMLAGAVMRLAGSPIYAGRGVARTLTDAVARLGIRTVRDSVFEVALKKTVYVATAYSDLMQRIGRHGTATAYLARIVCRHARVVEEQAFLGALLHDIGFAALLLAMVRKNEQPPSIVELWPAVDAMHEQASKAVTKLWGLSPELSLVVGNHHHEHTGTSVRVAAAVNIADFLSERFDAHIVGPPDENGVPLAACAISPASVEDSRSLLGLGVDALDRIAAEATPILHEVLRD